MPRELKRATKVEKLAVIRFQTRSIKQEAIIDIAAGLFFLILFIWFNGLISGAEAIQPGATRGLSGFFIYLIFFPLAMLLSGALYLYRAVKIDNILRELEV